MAPYTPFLTEHMYQHLKKFVVDEALGETEKGSVHFLMPPNQGVYVIQLSSSLLVRKTFIEVFFMHTLVELFYLVKVS